jgi:hypothetical protein
VIWKLLSRTARLYTFLFVIFGGYATYSLARVFAGLGNLRELAVLARVECRIANVRQFILITFTFVWDDCRE